MTFDGRRLRHSRPIPPRTAFRTAVVRGFLVAAAAFASSWNGVVAQAPERPLPDSVRDYVSVAMTVFRTHSVHRSVVDWTALEDSVLAMSAGAQVPSDTWLALSWAFRRVDRHSFLQPPEGALGVLTGGLVPQQQQTAARVPRGRLLDGVGIVTVPAHPGPNRPSYADSIHAHLAALDSAGVCGWVVDLRDNTGGNMWPMLAGIGPLLGAELVGSFTDSPAGSGWRYRDGRSWSGTGTAPADPHGSSTAPPAPLAQADAPVALLVGDNTASSGEMVLLAFLGRPDVRSFGDSTAGFASANKTVPLRDGALVVVTSSYPRDRLGRRYPLRLAPDEVVPTGDGSDRDAALRRAVDWLQRQPACVVRQEPAVDPRASRSTST